MLHRYDYVVTRDGIRLATDIYLPADGRTQPCPADSVRKYDERAVAYAEWMASTVSCVVQMSREHDSDGNWHPTKTMRTPTL